MYVLIPNSKKPPRICPGHAATLFAAWLFSFEKNRKALKKACKCLGFSVYYMIMLNMRKKVIL